MGTISRRARTAATVLASAVLLAVACATWPASATTERTFTYVALGSTYVIGPDLAAAAVRQTTGVDAAPLGRVDFVAEGDSITLTIDDAAALAGTVHVSASHAVPGSNEWVHRHLCVPVRVPTVISVAAGQEASVTIWDLPAFYTGGCDHGGSAGTATIAF